MMIDVRLLRAARVLLGWSQADLAEKAGLARNSVVRLEDGTTDPRRSTLVAIQKVLEEGGVEFLPKEGGKGQGLRLLDDS